jgi:lambda family phage minor tail protein L
MTLTTDLNNSKPAGSPYIEFFDVDCSAFGGPEWHLTNSTDKVNDIVWNGIPYVPFPIQGNGWTTTTDQPPRPKLTVSNANTLIQPYVLNMQAFLGVKVTRTRTLYKYTDNGSSPDTSQHLPIEIYFIQQMQQMSTGTSADTIVFILCTPLDQPNIKLPLRQCLKDNVGGNTVYMPGLSTVRFRP